MANIRRNDVSRPLAGEPVPGLAQIRINLRYSGSLCNYRSR